MNLTYTDTMSKTHSPPTIPRPPCKITNSRASSPPRNNLAEFTLCFGPLEVYSPTTLNRKPFAEFNISTGFRI